jgi:hypothetical protein
MSDTRTDAMIAMNKAFRDMVTPTTVINPDADFDARRYNLPGHAQGLRMNDPVTLHSLFGILAHAAGCTGCSQCQPDGN